MNCICKGQGPALVLQHGFMSGSDYWQQQIEALSDMFTVIAPNLPGFGLNAHIDSPASISGYIDAIMEDLDALGFERFSLVGHSMGGMIAQEIALRHSRRIDRLILYCTGPLGELPGRFESISESRSHIENGGLESTRERTVASWFLHRENDPNYPAALTLARLAKKQAVLAGLSAMEQWQSVDRLHKLDVQTLVLWADRDRTYPWSQVECLWKSISNSSLAVLPGSAHNLHLEQAALFNNVVRTFLTVSE